LQDDNNVYALHDSTHVSLIETSNFLGKNSAFPDLTAALKGTSP